MAKPEPAISQDQPRLTLGGKTILPGLSAGHVAYHWIIQSFVVLLPEIQAAFSLSAVGVGGLVTAREVAAGVVALPGGAATDAVRRYWGLLLSGCLAVLAIGSIAVAVSPSYWLLLVSIGVLAAAHSIWHLAASGSLSHHYAQRRGTALSLHGVGGSTGDVAGPLVTGALLLVLTWREIISGYAAAPIFLAVLAVWAFRNIGHTGHESAAGGAQGRLQTMRSLLRNRALWGLTVVRGLRSMALVALVTTLPLYLNNDLELSKWSRGFHIGMLIAVGLVAKTGAGYLSDRWGRKQVLVPGLIWSCAMAVALMVVEAGPMLTVVIGLLGLFLYPDQPILTAAIYDSLGRDVATTGLGAAAFASFLMAAASPLIAGYLYDGMGFGVVLWYVAGLFMVSAVVFAALPLQEGSKN